MKLEESIEEGLGFVKDLVDKVQGELEAVLMQRAKDRKFVDQRVWACAGLNETLNGAEASIFGQRDAEGRVIVGPANGMEDLEYMKPRGQMVASLPEFLKGDHVTLFGLADSEQSCKEAMNAFEIKLDAEPTEVVDELLAKSSPPRWGVDAEDSQTPLQEILTTANANLAKCFNNEITGSSHPIKRLPGLGLPSPFCTYKNKAVPLHLYDLGLHVFNHWGNPKALVFYMPKLENEEEAAYLAHVIHVCEEMVKQAHPEYVLGTVRVLVVLENARAVFRVNEIMDALHPYFAGASLGWHDFLASTARLFKNDPMYRIPVKADPSIVMKHVKASHELVANVVGGRGGIAIGGMYGILPLDANGMHVCIRGFFMDVVTQLKRGLRGFWVARPDFVRLGMGIVEAFKRMRQNNPSYMEKLVRGYLSERKDFQDEVMDFIFNRGDPSVSTIAPPTTPATAIQFAAGLIVSNVTQSSQIANNDPKEVAYNVFQSLQYLADWLAGNGCVALPATVLGQSVMIMDDLATVERSRWEVWHEVHHRRFPVEQFIRICHTEMNAIRRELKHVHVKFDARTSNWYPVALEIFIKLVTDPTPVEFVTELLLPFCSPSSSDRSTNATLKCENVYVDRFHYFFERCGAVRFATEMAKTRIMDLKLGKALVMSFTKNEIIEAAGFHGDIGQSAKTLDKMAESEQAKVAQGAEAIRQELQKIGQAYKEKFNGVKFLVSAKGKSGEELLAILKERYNNDLSTELENARLALWEITLKRIHEHPIDELGGKIERLLQKHKIMGAQISISGREGLQSFCVGRKDDKNVVEPGTLFEIASLSKTVGSAFAIEYFTRKGIPLTTSANAMLEQAGSEFRLTHEQWGDKVQLVHLMSHCALNMHYVNGVPVGAEKLMLNMKAFLNGNEKYGYPKIDVINEPGTVFRYSGGGFIVLQHIIETMEGGKDINSIVQPFLHDLDISSTDLTFDPMPEPTPLIATGYDDEGKMIQGTRKMFPGFAAGAYGNGIGMLTFLRRLAQAFQDKNTVAPISHDTACTMLYGTDKGCRDFMGCLMGVGVFVGESGPNRFTIHQGANDGYRGVFFHCFDGPSFDTGLAIFANGDNRAMLFIAETMQEILRELKIEGIDLGMFDQTQDLVLESIPQEEIVNFGYKNMVFNAMQPTLPDEIIDHNPINPLAKVNKIIGGQILKVSNQRFARAENLLSPYLPKFDPELFCPMGKVMDSWETARHNVQGYDFVEIQLPRPADIRYVVFSTKYHYGNQVEFVELYVKQQDDWKLIVPKTHLDGHAEKFVLLDQVCPVDQIRVHAFPDGGLTRIGLFGENDLPQQEKAKYTLQGQSIKCSDPIPMTKKPLQLLYTPSADEVARNVQKLNVGDRYDTISLAYGGQLVSVTNQHYGPAAQVLSPFVPLSMHDGFESARSREPNHTEELIVSLGSPNTIDSIELDFTFFVNNNPRHIAVYGMVHQSREWIELVPETFTKPYAGNTQTFPVTSDKVFEQLKLLVFPDGGVNRLRAFGHYQVNKKSNL